MPADPERRRFPRHAIRGEAEVRFTSWTLFKLLFTVNISKGGMAIEMHEEPPLGTRLVIRIVTPTGDRIPLEAVVRHVTTLSSPINSEVFVSRFQVGVEFVNLGQAKRDQIEALIRKHAPYG